AKQSHSVREKPVKISRKLPLGRVIMLDICFNLGKVAHLMLVCACESKIQDVLILPLTIVYKQKVQCFAQAESHSEQ
ncbi:MAG: hypothetical protein K8R91_01390, partial [Phycisphaerae bacterium]|nr:hypothetical protein [Phycisphaerae bacterium]